VESLIIVAICGVAFFAGLLIPGRDIKKCEKRITELEKEKIYYQAERERLLSDIDSLRKISLS